MAKSSTVGSQAASLRLSCDGAACRGSIKLWYDNVSLGARGYRLAAGHTGPFATPLSNKALRLLARAKHHTLNVGVTVTVSGGATNRVQVPLVSSPD